MSSQGIATSVLLPPLVLVLLSIGAGLFAWRPAWSGAVTCIAGIVVLLLATPFAAGHLRASLESSHLRDTQSAPAAIIVLAADASTGPNGADVGKLTLQRLRTGAQLARSTGLPLLVTGGPAAPGESPVAQAMAISLENDFGLSARWLEPLATDTRDNAHFSAAILRVAGIESAYVVTHAWHMPRTLDAFARTGFAVRPAAVAPGRVPDGRASDWIPRPDHLATSWFMLREWAGILVYRLRDGPVPQRQ
jgi:uncharacterized SAM-binding protein YcdF (DUF218 family)